MQTTKDFPADFVLATIAEKGHPELGPIKVFEILPKEGFKVTKVGMDFSKMRPHPPMVARWEWKLESDPNPSLEIVANAIATKEANGGKGIVRVLEDSNGDKIIIVTPTGEGKRGIFTPMRVLLEGMKAMEGKVKEVEWVQCGTAEGDKRSISETTWKEGFRQLSVSIRSAKALHGIK